MVRLACGIGIGTLLLVVTFGAWATSHTTPLAGRYHLRQRTTQFFERANTPETPSEKRPTVSQPVCLCQLYPSATAEAWKAIASRCPLHGNRLEAMGRNRDAYRAL